MAAQPEVGLDLSAEDYRRIAALVHREAGIALGDDKRAFVRARLGKRLRERGCSTYQAYLDQVEADATGQALSDLIDAIATNTTRLFREDAHFEFLRGVLGRLAASGRQTVCRIWSAACSSGEEAYSIAITADDALRGAPHVRVRILGTDISSKALASARRGLFAAGRMEAAPAEFVARYFERRAGAHGDVYVADARLRDLITFSRFNLMTESLPFRNAFDVIFCRNVMIYFDQPTREGVVNRFAKLLHPGGYLMVGHSERLHGANHPFQCVAPAVYQLPI